MKKSCKQLGRWAILVDQNQEFQATAEVEEHHKDRTINKNSEEHKAMEVVHTREQL